jgi:hypothetical protein
VRRGLGPEWSRAVLDPALGRQLVRARFQTARRSARPPVTSQGPLLRAGTLWALPMGDLLPAQARDANLFLVVDLLDRLGVPFFVVRVEGWTRRVVAVDREHRDRVLAALADLWPEEPAYVRLAYGDEAGPAQPATGARAALTDPSVDVVSVWRTYRAASGGLTYGDDFSCQVEFWTRTRRYVQAPRINVASDVLTQRDLAPATVRVRDRELPTAAVFTKTMIGDIDFPIDVVYTWVDGSDPAWRERMLRTRERVLGEPHHEEAVQTSRFVSRDELRYSLRSLAMFAPWVRHVYLVTDQQRPGWLRTDTDRLTVVDHTEIFPDAAALPVFNSNAIISRLHHVPGLGEHYIYVNDDVFFGQPARPESYFTAMGLARVFPARNRRPFGPVRASEEPHFNLSRNIRALLERDFGRTLAQAVRHTPHPQLRSVHEEMEARYPQEYDHTVRSAFRHPDDIVGDQLFHYYAQLTRRAVPAGLSYEYINVGLADHADRLHRLLRRRNRQVFCLNDAPQPGKPAMPEAAVRAFFEEYFPVPSPFEITG